MSKTDQNLAEVFVGLLPSFEDALGIVDSTGILLQTEEYLPGCRGAVHTTARHVH
jgi:hypothetical protein